MNRFLICLHLDNFSTHGHLNLPNFATFFYHLHPRILLECNLRDQRFFRSTGWRAIHRLQGQAARQNPLTLVSEVTDANLRPLFQPIKQRIVQFRQRAEPEI